jgi:hypothetical protein
VQKTNGTVEAIDTGVETVLREYEKHYLAGHEIAAIDALRFCRQQHLALPDWLGEMVTDTLTSYLAGKKAPGRGRSASPLARYIANYKDYCRWHTVQRAVSAEPSKNVASPSPKRKLPANRSTSGPCDPPLHHGFMQAHLELRGSIARGSVKTMERAYWRVERTQKKGMPIYLARRDTLTDLGVEMPENCSESTRHG